MQIYRVKNSESVYDIAREYGVSPIRIAYDNDLEIRGRLPRGREILVITPSRTYSTRSQDTLEGIARRFKTSKESLLRLNPELGGRDKLYAGQTLSVRNGAPSYGMISANGYLYSGTSKESLLSLIPYLSYVTVCSAVYKDGRVHNLFPSNDTVALVRAYGRAPMLRIYLTELPSTEGAADFASSVGILAGSAGFAGVTLSNLSSLSRDVRRLESLVLTVRKQLIDNGLLLFAEGDLESNTSYIEYADAGVLTYDKLHKADIPSFADGERATLEGFAYSSESSRAFVEISSFAYSGGKYIEKREAMRITDKKHGEIFGDSERKLQIAAYGKHKRREIILESLENTKAKLELVSELGFMGISFDIGRVCVPDLMMAASMFDVISYPAMLPKTENQEI
jgi:LysM repeat protein